MRPKAFFNAGPAQAAAWALYQAAVDRARQPAFYVSCGLPDSLDGRFEMLALHCYVLLRRLRGLGAEGRALSQHLVDRLVQDLDRNLRELGVGDLAVGKRVRRMVEAFYGRIDAYDRALEEGEAALQAAVRRNVFGTVTPAPGQVAAIAAYLRREAVVTAAAGLSSGRAEFGPPPSLQGEGPAPAEVD